MPTVNKSPDIENLEKKKDITGLINALQNENKDVRRAAAKALGSLKDTQAIDPLLRALEDSEKDVRNTAAEALAGMGAPAIKPLFTALMNEKREVRHAAANALGILKDPSTVEPLINNLTGADNNLRQGAASALGLIGDPRAVEPLITMLSNGENDLRGAAADGLGYIGDSRAVEPLLAVLDCQNPLVRISVISALGRIGDTRAVDPLLTALKSSLAPQKGIDLYGQLIACSVIEALGNIGDARAVDPIIASLSDRQWGVRKYAAEALGKMGDARAVEPLNKIINFEFEMDNVREAATRALQKIGGKPIHAATIHQVYSFIAANILLTASKPEDQQLIQRILAYASKNLSENKPNFKKLYEAVENENSPHLLGTGMAASPKVFSEAFTGWIKSRGISINDYASLVDKQIFILAGDATNPQNGQSFPWGVFIYFDLESKELTSRKTDSHNPFVFRNGQKAYAVEDLARICREAPADALFHLLEGHFEPWLTYIGRDDLAQRAKSARLSSGSDETRLSAFLGAI